MIDTLRLHRIFRRRWLPAIVALLAFYVCPAYAGSLGAEILQEFDAREWVKGLLDTEACHSIGQELVTTFEKTRPATLQLVQFEDANSMAMLAQNDASKQEFIRLVTQAGPGVDEFIQVNSRMADCYPITRTKADSDWKGKMGLVAGSYEKSIGLYQAYRAILKLP